MKNSLFFLAIIMFLFWKPIKAGDADYGFVYGSKAHALNGLYFAGSSGLHNLISNPSALVFLKGGGVEFSAANRLGEQEFNSPNRGLFVSFRDDDYSIGGGAYWKINEDFSAAIAYLPAVDYRVNWPMAMFLTNQSSAVVLTFDMYNRIKFNSITPSLAYKIGNISIGLSANIYNVTFASAFPQGNPLWNSDIGAGAYQMQYDMESWAYGGTLGFSYIASNEVTLGLSVRSGVKAELEGTARNPIVAEIDSSASETNINSAFEIPWLLGLGVLFQASENIAINADVSYGLWSNVSSSMDVLFDNPLWNSRFSSTDSLTGINAGKFQLNFKDNLEAGIGIEYQAASDLNLRAGYRFSQSPNSPSTFNLLFPSVDQHRISIGLGYVDERLTIDASVSYSFGASKEITAAENNILYGTYSSDTFIPTVTLHYAL